MPEFKLTQQTDGSYSAEGDLTFTSLDKKAIKNVACLNPDKTTSIDLGKVNSADSAGLALMIEWIKQSKLCNTKLKLINIPQQLITLATLSGLDMNQYSD